MSFLNYLIAIFLEEHKEMEENTTPQSISRSMAIGDKFLKSPTVINSKPKCLRPEEEPPDLSEYLAIRFSRSYYPKAFKPIEKSEDIENI